MKKECKQKYTKHALCMSILSLLLCCSMLVGTTFAWFTDSMTSGRNKIVAGNLEDVELYHGTGAAEIDKVTKDTKLFVQGDGSEIQWEPGVIAYENFTVKNVGTLALKYKLAMNVWGSNTVEYKGEQKSLADVIKVAILKDHFTGDRAEAQGQDFDSKISDFVETNENLAPGTDEKFAVILYWEPSDDDDIYNLKNGTKSSDGEPLWIDLGIDLRATQTPNETDSFDKNYDEGLTLPEPMNVTASQTLTTTQTEGGQAFYHVGNNVVSVDIPSEDVTSAITKVFLVVETTGVTESSYDLDISLEDQDHHEIANTTGAKMYRVNVNIGTGKLGVEVSHEHDAMKPGGSWSDEGYTYDEFTGILTLYVKHFSEFEITWVIPKTAEERVEMLEEAGYTAIKRSSIANSYFRDDSLKVYLTQKTTNASWLTVAKDTIIDLNGNTLSFTMSRGNGFEVQSNSNLLIRNGTISFGSTVKKHGIDVSSGNSHITLENCTIKMTANQSFALYSTSPDAVFTLRNCNIETPHTTGARGYSAWISGAKFDFINCNVTGHMIIDGGSLNIDGGTYTATGFNGQNHVWGNTETASFINSLSAGMGGTMGDCVLILDHRASSPQLTDVTVKNATFNTTVDGIGTLYAVKYVDMQKNADSRSKITLANNTYNNKIDGNDPVMFIDIDGNDLG